MELDILRSNALGGFFSVGSTTNFPASVLNWAETFNEAFPSVIVAVSFAIFSV